jgi:hypothetical protein
VFSILRPNRFCAAPPIDVRSTDSYIFFLLLSPVKGGDFYLPVFSPDQRGRKKQVLCSTANRCKIHRFLHFFLLLSPVKGGDFYLPVFSPDQRGRKKQVLCSTADRCKIHRFLHFFLLSSPVKGGDFYLPVFSPDQRGRKKQVLLYERLGVSTYIYTSLVMCFCVCTYVMMRTDTKYNVAIHPSKSDTLDGLKVQDVEITTRWHNIHLGTTIFFFFTTVLFWALFGGYYTAFVRERDGSTSLAVVESLVTKTSSDAICTGHAPTFETFSEEEHCMVATNDGVYAILDLECQYACDKYRKLELVNAGNHFTLNDLNNGTARLETINGVTYAAKLMNSTWWDLSNGAWCSSNGQTLSTGQGCWCSGDWSFYGCMNSDSSSLSITVPSNSWCTLQQVLQDDYIHKGWACMNADVSIVTPTDAVPTNGIMGILNMASQCQDNDKLLQTDGMSQGCWCESPGATIMQNSYSNSYLCYKGIQQSANVTCADGSTPFAVSRRDGDHQSVGWVCGKKN